ncbi:hypothetical protein A7P53_10720 [Acinetobacter defluvii]|uniref:hypothetical protein n=1 Tax=Acinetobacter defluvii TaxID=1871111 RepID=UPI00148F589A|nr:hypothetical protein [Acinetobacter defluvii]NNP73041.1 hypothetical protein [Acinetobacter defluvii]
MKIKALSFAVLSSIMLAACGGSNSDDSSNNTTGNGQTGGNTSVSNGQWTSYDFYTNQKDGYFIDKEVLTLKDGKAYSKETSTDPSYHSYKGLTVTIDGLYDEVNAPLDTELGHYSGTVQASNTQWTLNPYSSIGSKGLQYTTKYTTLNLSGKNLLEAISPSAYYAITQNLTDKFPVQHDLLDLYTTISKVKFPEGSSCLQLKEFSNTQEYLDLDADLNNKEQQNTLAQSWLSWKNDKTATLRNFKDTTAYLKADTFSNESYGYALYKNNYYSAFLTQKGVEFNMDESLKDYEDDLKNGTPEEKLRATYLLAAAKNVCHLYNEKAAQTIASTVKF